MNDNDLSFVSTDEIVAELRKRFDAILIVHESTVEKSSNVFDCLYSGGVSYCLGLAERAKARLLKIALEDHQPYKGE